MELFSFYNVENLFPPDPESKHKLNPTYSGLRNWDERKYRNKLLKIAHVFRMMKDLNAVLPFMIGLAEVSGRSVLEDLVQLEPFNGNYGFVHYPSKDERKIDVALLYDKAKIEVMFSEAITFHFENLHKNTENSDTTRDVLRAKVKYKEQVITIFIVHLPSKREKDSNRSKRSFILNEVRNLILHSINKDKEPVILCGDFNENPDHENVIHVLYDNMQKKRLENPFEQLFSKRKYSVFHHKRGMLFDQIILSEDFFSKDHDLRFQEADVFCPEKICSRDKKFAGRPLRTFAGTRYLGGYSDHFPVFVRVSNL